MLNCLFYPLDHLDHNYEIVKQPWFSTYEMITTIYFVKLVLMQKIQLKTQTSIAVTNERIKAARLTSKLTKQN